MTRIKHLVAATVCLLGLALATPLLPGSSAFAADDGSVKDLRGGVPIEQENAKPQVYGTVEGTAYTKAYRQQPPLIPHRIDKYEIDLKTNQCLSCHDWPQNTQFNAPKVSETHYIDRQGNRLDNVARTRWFCVQCHVPQSDAPELVQNVFQPAAK